jgi:hypothetical protein
MVVMNTSKIEKNISFKNYAERTGNFSKYKNILTSEMGSMTDFKLSSYQSIVLELVK